MQPSCTVSPQGGGSSAAVTRGRQGLAAERGGAGTGWQHGGQPQLSVQSGRTSGTGGRLLCLLVGGHRAWLPVTSVCARTGPELMASHHGSCGDINSLVPCCTRGCSNISSHRDCSGVPHHLADSLPRGESLHQSRCCLDVILELLLPCSKAFNSLAEGQQWLLALLLGAGLLLACLAGSPEAPGWGLPWGDQSQGAPY